MKDIVGIVQLGPTIACALMRRRLRKILHTQRRSPYEDRTERFEDAGLEDGSELCTSQGALAATRSWKSPGTGSALELLRGTAPCCHLDVGPVGAEFELLSSKTIK